MTCTALGLRCEMILKPASILNLKKNNYPDGRELYNYFAKEDNLRNEFDRAVRFFVMNRITFQW